MNRLTWHFLAAHWQGTGVITGTAGSQLKSRTPGTVGPERELMCKRFFFFTFAGPERAYSNVVCELLSIKRQIFACLPEASRIGLTSTVNNIDKPDHIITPY